MDPDTDPWLINRPLLFYFFSVYDIVSAELINVIIRCLNEARNAVILLLLGSIYERLKSK